MELMEKSRDPPMSRVGGNFARMRRDFAGKTRGSDSDTSLK
jgi:hypothetical protein